MSHCVNIYTEKDFCDWFKKEYKPALEFIGIRHRKYIYNINKKGCYIICSLGEKVIILIRIKEIYVKVPKNRLFITVIKSISADDKAIPFLVIMPGRNIIMSWFSKNITKAKVIMILPLSYTNKGIYI
jgi:hypothetical protein